MNIQIERIYQLTKTNIKLKNYGSTFGLAWIFLKPTLSTIIIYFVITNILGIQNQTFTELFYKIMIWNFFSDMTIDSLRTNKLFRGIYHNTNTHPAEVITSIILTHIIENLIKLVIIIPLFYILINSTAAITANVLIGIILLLLVSILGSFVIALSGMILDDIQHAWTIFLYIAFWIHPIFYNIQNIPENLVYIYSLSPIVHIYNIIYYNQKIPYIIPAISLIILATATYYITKTYGKQMAQWT